MDGISKKPGKIIGVSPTISRKLPYLASFFPEDVLASPFEQNIDALAVWGDKRPARLLKRLAGIRSLPVWQLEDGFLRSVGLGKNGAATVSIIVDDQGIYFDARHPSRLESLIGSIATDWVQTPQAAEALDVWRQHRLTKYNTDLYCSSFDRRPGVVLIDQVAGDASIPASGASCATFAKMLEAALQEFDTDRIVVRVHPDVAAGKAQGYLSDLAHKHKVAILDQGVSEFDVISQAEEVWTVSSQFGFNAILHGCKVVCFAMPFYNGWGLCADRSEGGIAEAARGRRSARPTAEQAFDAALLRYPRYADPIKGEPTDFFGAVERILDWRARADRTGHTVCFRFPAWKRRAANIFLGGPAATVTTTPRASAGAVRKLAAGATRLAVWGATPSRAFLDAVKETGLPLHFVEDGFLRSVGLGSDLRTPGSLVVDDRGMYYDASRPSLLEHMLENGLTPASAIAQAPALRQALLQHSITKYNIAAAHAVLPPSAAGRKVIVLAEQVPGDAAIASGGGDLDGNLDFAKRVRIDNADAFMIYKEHPDLVAGNRSGRLGPGKLADTVDLVVSEGDIAGLFAVADEVHVVSSLAGFEALMRDIPVTVWGRPFYAGWGLTKDKLAFPRRTRRLTFDELLGAAYIAYPSYADPVSGIPCNIEDFLHVLMRARTRPPPRFRKGPALQMIRFYRWLSGRAAT